MDGRVLQVEVAYSWKEPRGFTRSCFNNVLETRLITQPRPENVSKESLTFIRGMHRKWEILLKCSMLINMEMNAKKGWHA